MERQLLQIVHTINITYLFRFINSHQSFHACSSVKVILIQQMSMPPQNEAADIMCTLVDKGRLDFLTEENFGQEISIAIQCGNAAGLLGTFPSDSDADEYFDG
ncbi:hypothetical protein SFRURICE_019342 [Spodoptera frugiperda]|nr:hypothetical protein SFRURICE_019342 [Spodoptera frugiperda]